MIKECHVCKEEKEVLKSVYDFDKECICEECTRKKIKDLCKGIIKEKEEISKMLLLFSESPSDLRH